MPSPKDDDVLSTFRQIISDLYRADNLGDLTVKRVRIAAEDQLNLPSGWFKDHEEWRERSKSYITEEAERQFDAIDHNKDAEKTDSVVPKKEIKRRVKDVESVSPPRKKQKSGRAPNRKTHNARKVVDSDDEDDTDSNVEAAQSIASENTSASPEFTGEAFARASPSKVRKKKGSKEAESSASEDGRKKLDARSEDPVEEDAAQESDMSSLIDEVPAKPTKSKIPSRTKDPKGKPKKKPKDADLSPDDIEVKKLKDWLGKCGVRKMWANELATCETPKQKISHLRQMLKDVGMDGRPSVAKANEIRERRELAEELEEAQKFDQQWGKSRSNGRGRSAAQTIANLGIEFDEESD